MAISVRSTHDQKDEKGGSSWPRTQLPDRSVCSPIYVNIYQQQLNQRPDQCRGFSGPPTSDNTKADKLFGQNPDEEERDRSAVLRLHSTQSAGRGTSAGLDGANDQVLDEAGRAVNPSLRKMDGVLNVLDLRQLRLELDLSLKDPRHSSFQLPFRLVMDPGAGFYGLDIAKVKEAVSQELESDLDWRELTFRLPEHPGYEFRDARTTELAMQEIRARLSGLDNPDQVTTIRAQLQLRRREQSEKRPRGLTDEVSELPAAKSAKISPEPVDPAADNVESELDLDVSPEHTLPHQIDFDEAEDEQTEENKIMEQLTDQNWADVCEVLNVENSKGLWGRGSAFSIPYASANVTLFGYQAFYVVFALLREQAVGGIVHADVPGAGKSRSNLAKAFYQNYITRLWVEVRKEWTSSTSSQDRKHLAQGLQPTDGLVCPSQDKLLVKCVCVPGSKTCDIVPRFGPVAFFVPPASIANTWLKEYRAMTAGVANAPRLIIAHQDTLRSLSADDRQQHELSDTDRHRLRLIRGKHRNHADRVYLQHTADSLQYIFISSWQSLGHFEGVVLKGLLHDNNLIQIRFSTIYFDEYHKEVNEGAGVWKICDQYQQVPTVPPALRQKGESDEVFCWHYPRLIFLSATPWQSDLTNDMARVITYLRRSRKADVDRLNWSGPMREFCSTAVEEAKQLSIRCKDSKAGKKDGASLQSALAKKRAFELGAVQMFVIRRSGQTKIHGQPILSMPPLTISRQVVKMSSEQERMANASSKSLLKRLREAAQEDRRSKHGVSEKRLASLDNSPIARIGASLPNILTWMEKSGHANNKDVLTIEYAKQQGWTTATGEPESPYEKHVSLLMENHKTGPLRDFVKKVCSSRQPISRTEDKPGKAIVFAGSPVLAIMIRAMIEVMLRQPNNQFYVGDVGKGKGVEVLTSAFSASKREDIYSRLNDLDDPLCFLVSTPKIAGTGLNLQGAHDMLFFDVPESCNIYKQSPYRHCRSGTYGARRAVFLQGELSTYERLLWAVIEENDKYLEEIIGTVVRSDQDAP